MNIVKIVWNLMDSLRGQLQSSQLLEFSCQLLLWAKLSQEGKIPTDLSFDKDNRPTSAQQLTDIFSELNALEEVGNAFRDIGVDLDDVSVLQALDILQDVFQAGLPKRFEIPDSFSSFLSDRGIGQSLIPEEVADLMINLADDLKGKDIYCPYDNLGQLARRVNKVGGTPFAELSTTSPLFWLINHLTDTSINAVVGEPVRNPSFTERGELKQFDVSLACPPIGKKADKELVERDFFNRFSYRTSSWSILSILHILAQTKERAIIIIPNNILFSSGAEKSLREDLLKRGLIETITCFPPAILPFTGIKISIIVLNRNNQSDSVRFVDASSEKFSAKDGRGRSQLTNVDGLIETTYQGQDESIAVTVPVQEILDNDANLEISRYLRSPKKKRIEKILSQEKTVQLESLVDFIRPPAKSRDETEGEEALEVTLADFPKYGYIGKPERSIAIDPSKLKSNADWLHPEDIIIGMKGSAGKVAIVPHYDFSPEEERWVANQSCLILRTKRDIHPKVLYMYLHSEIGQNLLQSMVSGATIPLIKLQTLKELLVILPSEEEAKKVIDAFNKITDLQSEIDTLRGEQESLSRSYWSV